MRKKMGMLNIGKGLKPVCYFNKKIEDEGFVRFMTKTGEFKYNEKVPKECVKGVCGEVEFSIFVKGLVDVQKELQLIKKNEMKLVGNIQKLEKKMGTKKYEKVPEKVQEREREALEGNRKKLEVVLESRKLFEMLI